MSLRARFVLEHPPIQLHDLVILAGLLSFLCLDLLPNADSWVTGRSRQLVFSMSWMVAVLPFWVKLAFSKFHPPWALNRISLNPDSREGEATFHGMKRIDPTLRTTPRINSESADSSIPTSFSDMRAFISLAVKFFLNTKSRYHPNNHLSEP